MFNLAVCAIVKNEGLYIEEFLEYHLLQGVEHFFIYDNQSTDNTLEILRRYEDLGLATVTAIYGMAAQLSAYRACLVTYGSSSKWIAFIDCDEFLYAKYWPSLVNYLNTFADDVAVVTAHWVLFGSNGLKEYDDRLCIERFTRRQIGTNPHVKSIVRPKLIVSVGRNPHSFIPKSGAYVVDEQGNRNPNPHDYALNHEGSSDILRCIHFHTKSLGEYRTRKSSHARADIPGGFTPERLAESFAAHDMNNIEDNTLKAFAGQVKRKILERK